MSPLSLSAPAGSQAKPQGPTGVHFGKRRPVETPQETPESSVLLSDPVDTAEIGHTPETSETNDPEVVKNGENDQKKPTNQPEKPHFFQVLTERIRQFFHHIAKAFQKLFGIEKPKTPLEKELKQLKHNLKPENVQVQLKQRAKEIQEEGSPAEKEFFAPLLEAAKTDKGLKQYAEVSADVTKKRLAGAVHLLNNPEELAALVEEFDNHPEKLSALFKGLAELFSEEPGKDQAVQTEEQPKDTKPKQD